MASEGTKVKRFFLFLHGRSVFFWESPADSGFAAQVFIHPHEFLNAVAALLLEKLIERVSVIDIRQEDFGHQQVLLLDVLDEGLQCLARFLQVFEQEHIVFQQSFMVAHRHRIPLAVLQRRHEQSCTAAFFTCAQSIFSFSSSRRSTSASIFLCGFMASPKCQILAQQKTSARPERARICRARTDRGCRYSFWRCRAPRRRSRALPVRILSCEGFGRNRSTPNQPRATRGGRARSRCAIRNGMESH